MSYITFTDVLENLFRRGFIDLNTLENLPSTTRSKVVEILDILVGEGSVQNLGNGYRLVRRVEALLTLVRLGLDESRFLPYIEWNEFEEYVARVLDEAGFEVLRNVRKDPPKGFQIDVLALDPGAGIALSIECKQWRYVRGFSRKILEIVSQHVERTKRFVESCEWFATRIPSLRKISVVVPTVLTLRRSRYKVVNGVPIVPMVELNDFVTNIRRYVDELELLCIENRCRSMDRVHGLEGFVKRSGSSSRTDSFKR